MLGRGRRITAVVVGGAVAVVGAAPVVAGGATAIVGAAPIIVGGAVVAVGATAAAVVMVVRDSRVVASGVIVPRLFPWPATCPSMVPTVRCGGPRTCAKPPLRPR